MLSGSSQEVNPFAERDPMVPSVSAASRAAASASGADGEILTRLAGVPTAIWLTPEAYPIDQVGDVVAESAKQADTTDRTAVFVVYGITDRDCVGGESSGGLSPDQYEEWVERIADAAGSRSAVILEPDALATASECDQVDQRTTLLREAVQELTDGGPAVYVDAGHAHWVDPTEMATMLTAAGVEDARGFSTNVAGYESVEDERDYAEQVKAALGDAS
ncbi:glycoside hydrolase family 6 protein [Aeromicrobium sp. UC242_57]|uniref:glycoside hydrolase family 6 protein n=1 Tax=Aeromicrobium sp. UC242_57 TaxID=3374624 RepID=UPI0037BD603E